MLQDEVPSIGQVWVGDLDRRVLQVSVVWDADLAWAPVPGNQQYLPRCIYPLAPAGDVRYDRRPNGLAAALDRDAMHRGIDSSSAGAPVILWTLRSMPVRWPVGRFGVEPRWFRIHFMARPVGEGRRAVNWCSSVSAEMPPGCQSPVGKPQLEGRESGNVTRVMLGPVGIGASFGIWLPSWRQSVRPGRQQSRPRSWLG